MTSQNSSTNTSQFLESRGVLASGRIAGRHHVWRKTSDGVGYMLGVNWPTLEDIEHPDHDFDTSLVEHERQEAEETGSQPSSLKSPPILRFDHTEDWISEAAQGGFLRGRSREVPKSRADIWEVTEKAADAVCKVCLSKSGRSSAADSSSRSGSSSSSTDEDHEAEA